jgi:hypothetical protein
MHHVFLRKVFTMNVLEPVNPLMQSIQYNGQEYYTSQYFHQQYKLNSVHGGKYQRHPNFLQAIRAIPAYEIYLSKKDIVELVWAKGKSGNDLVISLFKSVSYNPLTLLNATAQLALSHHLDDELNKQISVAVNTTMATQQGVHQLAELLPVEQAERELASHLRVGILLCVPEHIVQQEAVKMVYMSTGIDYRPFLIAAPAQSNISLDTMMLEPTDLAKVLEWGDNKGAMMNRTLADIGWQIKTIEGNWKPTPIGELHCAIHAWQSEHGTKSGYNLKWNVAAVREYLSSIKSPHIV